MRQHPAGQHKAVFGGWVGQKAPLSPCRGPSCPVPSRRALRWGPTCGRGCLAPLVGSQAPSHRAFFTRLRSSYHPPRWAARATLFPQVTMTHGWCQPPLGHVGKFF